MNQNSRSSSSQILVALLGGAAIGGLAVALSSTEAGRRLRHNLMALGYRLLGRTGPEDDGDDDASRAMFI